MLIHALMLCTYGSSGNPLPYPFCAGCELCAGFATYTFCCPDVMVCTVCKPTLRGLYGGVEALPRGTCPYVCGAVAGCGVAGGLRGDPWGEWGEGTRGGKPWGETARGGVLGGECEDTCVTIGVALMRRTGSGGKAVGVGGWGTLWAPWGYEAEKGG